jgi:ribosome recycling factor
MLKKYYQETEQRMRKSLESLGRDLLGVRTGKATTNMLDGIKVDYYGTMTTLNQVASLSAPDPKMLVIQPWESTIIPEVIKAIQKSDLGLNPLAEGNIIRLPIPPLTEERRLDMVKLVKKFGEDCKVSLRNIRRDIIEQIKKAEKASEITEDELHQGQKHVQEITDDFVKKIDEMIEAKEAEVMEV